MITQIATPILEGNTVVAERMSKRRLAILVGVGAVWIWALSTLVFWVLEAAPSNNRWTPFLAMVITLLVGGVGAFVSLLPLRVAGAAASAGLVGFAIAARAGSTNATIVSIFALGAAAIFGVLVFFASRSSGSLNSAVRSAQRVSGAVCLYTVGFFAGVWTLRAINAGTWLLAIGCLATTASSLWCTHRLLRPSQAPTGAPPETSE